jgi:carboxynorspermidine decarboxylase
VNVPTHLIPSPAYILRESALEANLEKIDYIQKKSGCHIILALKAFSMFSAFPLISKYMPGTTSSSLHEARLAREYFGKDVHVYSPGYKDEEFEELCGYATHITFNSISQWNKFKHHPAIKANNIECGLRLNPEHSEVNYTIYDPCGPHSRFGVTDVELEGNDLTGLDGLHFHTLCEKLVDSLERTFAVIEDKFGPLLHQMKWLNFGGGHGLTYQNYDADRLIKLLIHIRDKYNVQVILEPGAAVVYNTGLLMSTVVDITYNEMDIAILDTSATAHMPDVLEMPYRPEIIGSGKHGEKAYTYRLGGITCLSGDVIGDYSFDVPLEIGDKLIFTDMALYTMVKNTTFNGIQLPAITILKKDNTIDVVKKFGYEDFKNRLS